jgi:hypothetical protein
MVSTLNYYPELLTGFATFLTNEVLPTRQGETMMELIRFKNSF